MIDIRDGAVSFATHYEFPDGKALLSTATLRFRPEDQVRSSLNYAGFVVEQIYGDGIAKMSGRETESCWSSPARKFEDEVGFLSAG